MDIETKYKIVEKIIQSNDDELLQEINSLLNLSEGDFWKELPQEVKEAIYQAKAQLDRGEGIANEAVTAEMNKRFLNKQFLFCIDNSNNQVTYCNSFRISQLPPYFFYHPKIDTSE